MRELVVERGARVTVRVAIAVLAAGLIAAAIGLRIAVRSDPPPRALDEHRSAAAPVRPPDPAPIAAPSTAEPEPAPAVATLRESGPAAEPWDASATAVLDAVARRAVATSQDGCFVAGCAATFTFASAADRDRARAEIESSADYRAWTGGKQWAAAGALSGGRVRVALLLYRPD